MPAVSFPNGLDLSSLIHSFFLLLLLFLSSFITPLIRLSSCFPSFLPHSFTPLLLPSLGIGGNLQRCRLMTAETGPGHSGLLSGNTPGIQSRTSDIFLLNEMMSSEQLKALIIRLKLERTGKKVPLTVLVCFFLIPPVSLHLTHLNFASLPPEGELGSSFLIPKSRNVPLTSEVQTGDPD